MPARRAEYPSCQVGASEALCLPQRQAATRLLHFVSALQVTLRDVQRGGCP